MKFLTLIIALVILSGCSVQPKISEVGAPQPIVEQKPQKVSSFLIAGFYPYWEQSRFTPQVAINDSINLLYHAFVWPDADGNLIVPKNFKNTEIISISKNKGAKVLVSIGGGNTSKCLSTVLGNKVLFDKFASQLIDFVIKNNYDGIDIDWEFPKNQTDAYNLNKFVEYLRQNLGSKYVISIDLPYANYSGRYFDIDYLKNFVNYFVVMTYDYAGSWSSISGYNAPLKSGFCNSHDIQKSVEYWLARGVSSKTMLLGIPFFGRAFNADEPCQEFNQSYATTYRNVLSLLKSDEYQYFWDFMTKTPYLVNKKNKIYYSFDDSSSINAKIRYAFEMHLGGVAIWEITQDIVDNHHILLPDIVQTVKNNQLLN